MILVNILAFLMDWSLWSSARLEFLTHICEVQRRCRGVVRVTIRALEVPADGGQQVLSDLRSSWSVDEGAILVACARYCVQDLDNCRAGSSETKFSSCRIWALVGASF